MFKKTNHVTELERYLRHINNVYHIMLTSFLTDDGGDDDILFMQIFIKNRIFFDGHPPNDYEEHKELCCLEVSRYVVRTLFDVQKEDEYEEALLSLRRVNVASNSPIHCKIEIYRRLSCGQAAFIQ